MLLWLVVVVTVALVTTDVQTEPDNYSNWGGPEAGCSEDSGAAEVIVSCTLPSGNLTVHVDRSATYLKMICEENSTLVCDELAEAKPIIDKYIKSSRKHRRLNSLFVDGCSLAEESLACPLGLVGADETALVRLDGAAGDLEPVHLEGLNGVTKFRINYDVERPTSVPYEVLSRLPNLKSFTMKKATLNLTSEVGSVLPELKTLELAEGRIERIPRGAFKSTPDIQTLLLWNNKMKFIDVDAFEGLTKLVNLSLNANLLSHLPGGMFRHTPNLARIDLYANKLDDLSGELFAGLDKLEKILIFNNYSVLKLSNRTFSNLPSLNELSLRDSSIESIPGELFQNSRNLKKLDLKGNNIRTIPENTFTSQNLTVLNLSQNKIGDLSSEVFSGQGSMVELDLSHNELTSLPPELFSDMRSLKKLDLRNNFIRILEKSTFSGLGNLKELSLAENRIEYIHRATFEFTPSLEVLSLSKNNLTISRDKNVMPMLDPPYISDKSDSSPPNFTSYFSPLSHLPRLRIIDLSHNNVSIMCDDWFEKYSLTELNLSYNNITYLSIVDFNFSTNATINLQHNKIQYFEPPTNMNYQIEPTFLLDHNPYRCDCYLYRFISQSKQPKIVMPKIIIGKAKCAQPTARKGVKLVDLQPEVLTCDVDCKTGRRIESTSNDSTCNCVLNPIQLRMEMFCDSVIPTEFPKLPNGFSYTYLRLTNVSRVPSLPAEVGIVDFSSMNFTEAPIAYSVALNLTNNYLTKAPLELFGNNCSVYLSGNPFDCTCDGKGDVMALANFHQLIPDYKQLTCSDGNFVSNTDVDQLCAARNWIIISISLVIIGAIIIVITVILFTYQTELRIILRELGLWRGDVLGGEVFDAFVSFAHQDEAFVVQKLVPKLEKGKPPLKICVHYRDWIIGDYIPAQIGRSVKDSRYTIIVLTKNFVESMWGRMEFRTAHALDRVIILMLEDLSGDKYLDPELKAYISMNTYVKADDPLVWERLRDAVLRRKRSDLKSDKVPNAVLDVALENGQLVNRAR